MSAIEKTIRKEQEAEQRKEERKAARANKKATAVWDKWVKEEQPRIASFKKQINKMFPCLKGDFSVIPRKTPNYLEAPFTAVVRVEDYELEVRKSDPDDKQYTVFIPYETSRGYGWETHYTQVKLDSDAALKEQIRKYIGYRQNERERAQRYYDSLPIGNTD